MPSDETSNRGHRLLRKYTFSSGHFRTPLIVITLLIAIAVSLASSHVLPVQPPAPPTTLLPGDQRWGGVPSFLFGTTSTSDGWGNNLDVSLQAQAALKSSHFTLLRQFFFGPAYLHLSQLDGSQQTYTDDINNRFKTISNTGMTCLAVLMDRNPSDQWYNEQVIRSGLAQNPPCRFYEFGNEPDNQSYGMTDAESYITSWNAEIPKLRKKFPGIYFIGPATSRPNIPFIHAFLNDPGVRSNPPDAISFHYYACGSYNGHYSGTDALSSCIDGTGFNDHEGAGPAQSYEEFTRMVIHEVRVVDGFSNLPVGITEWNYSLQHGERISDASFMSDFSSIAMRGMIAGGLDFATQFSAMNYAGHGQLDLFDQEGNPKPQFVAMSRIIASHYSSSGTNTSP
jgi:hypothetical protein